MFTLNNVIKLIITLCVLITSINNIPLFEDEETDLELLNLTLTGNLSNYEENLTNIVGKYENFSWPQQHEIMQIYSNPKFKPLEDDDLFQGDILLPEGEVIAPNGSEVKTAVRIFNVWPLGIIPYTMDLSLRKLKSIIYDLWPHFKFFTDYKTFPLQFL